MSTIAPVSLVFIDSTVADYHSLMAGLVAGTEAIVLDPTLDGVEQITAALAGRREIQSVHLVSHGSPGCLRLGATQLSLETLDRYADLLRLWGGDATKVSSVQIYGCHVAAGDAGAELIEKLHQLTGAAIAASRLPVGSERLGGTWQLEVTLGDKTEAPFDATTLNQYASILPLVTLPQSLTGAGATWRFDANNPGFVIAGVPQEGTFFNGTTSQTDAFDPGNSFSINGTSFTPSDTVDITGSTLTTGTTVMSGLNVSLQHYADQTRPYLRTLLNLDNPSGSAITVTVRWSTDLGSDTFGTVVTTSSGDTTLDTGDRWFVTDDAPTFGDPALTFVFVGPGSPTIGAYNSIAQPSSGLTTVQFNTVTIPAGSTRNLLFFTGLQDTSANAQSTAPLFNSYNDLFASGLLTGLTPTQLANTLNFQFPVPTTNTAPTLTDTVVTLTNVDMNAGAPVGAVGTLVSQLADLVGGGGQNNVTDGDAGATTGIAMTAADTANGSWFYSTNNGTTWNPFGVISSTRSLLLTSDANTRVYFRPNPNYSGTIANAITFRAWDSLIPSSNGSIINPSINGGNTEFSTATDTASITVTPPTVSFSTATQSGTEGNTVTVTATLSNASTQAVTVPVTLSGSAAGSDYSGIPASITIPAGSTSANVVVTLTDDVAAEPDETIVLTMGIPTNATLGTTTVQTITIAANDFVVTNTNDSGEGSLRQAILNINASASGGTIAFAIPGAGVQTISITTALPTITKPVIIDGYTQSGASPNTLATGNNAVLMIELTDGANIMDGLNLATSNSTVRGLIVNRFNRGIIISNASSTNNVISGNFLGTDSTGTITSGFGNSFTGVSIFDGSSGNTVGGSTPAARNVISGNGLYGIETQGGAIASNTITGNYLGTDKTGTLDRGNGENGIKILDSQNQIITGNLLSGNGRHGILVEGTTSLNNQIQNNLIGTAIDGITAIGNDRNGIYILNASNTLIGGVGSGNVIQNSGINGVTVEGGTGNQIRGNMIANNVGLGIDLGGTGVTSNDNNDGDTGANSLQNFPIITSAIFNGTNTVITGALNSTANTAFQIDIFTNTAIDPLSFGEGQTLLTTIPIAANPSNNQTFSFTVTGDLTGQFITATATNAANNTSEFSAALNVTTILPVTNAAPLLDNSGSPVLTAIDEDVTNAANVGTKVSDLIAGLITDANGDPQAIAITGKDNTNGTWQYSTDGGTTWSNITTTSDTNATLLGATSFYSGNLGTTPSSQTWLGYTAVNIPVAGVPAPTAGTEFTSASGALVTTTANQRIYAGYSNYNIGGTLINAASPTLNNATGYSLSFDLQVLADSNTNTSRAGFSILLVSQDTTQAIELAFQRLTPTTGRIFAQDTSFVASELASFDVSQKTDYRVEVSGTTYKLFANNTQILTGNLRDYAAFPLPTDFPFNPYTKSNLIFLGDNTTSAQGTFNLSQVAVQTDNRVRFVPNADYNGTATIDFRAWDTTNGSAAGTIVNASGNGGTTPFSSAVETATITVNSVPDITSVTLPANGSYRAGQALDFTVVFDEAVTVSTATGTPSFPITLNTGGTVNATYISGSGTASLLFRYTVATGDLDTDGITVGSAIALNGGTIQNTGSKDAALTLPTVVSSGILVDSVVPTIAITSDKTTLKAGETATLTFTLSEDATDFIDTDIVVTGGTLSAITGSDKIYTATFTPTANSTTNGIISVASTTFTDATGNENADGSDTNNTVTITVDTIAPTVTIDLSDSALIAGETATVTFTFSEALSGFATTDITAENGTISGLAVTADPKVYTATFTPAVNIVDPTNAITVANTYTDVAGNPGVANTSANYTLETQVPAITSITSTTADGTYGIGKAVNITVNFNKPVTLTGNATLTLDTGATLTLNPFSNATSVSATYTVAAGQTSPDLNVTNFVLNPEVTLTDAASNTALLTIPTGQELKDNKAIVIDRTAPTLNGTPALTIAEDSPYTFTPTAVDPDPEVLTFAITNKPTWATFDPASGKLSGTPTNANVGTTTGITISVNDGVDTVNLPAFNLTVTNTNDSPLLNPTIANTFANQTATATELLKITVPPTLFSDSDPGDTLTLSATLESGAALPTWLKFDAKTGLFSGTPSLDSVGNLSLKVTATDAIGTQSSQLLRVTIANPTGITGTALPVIDFSGGKKGVTLKAQKGKLLKGTYGSDVLRGTNGNDRINSGKKKQSNGKDKVYGLGGNDRLTSGGGSDSMEGGRGNDFLKSGNGRDLLLGGDGNDRMFGENGDDILIGGNGTDTLVGGAGRDMFGYGALTEGKDTIVDFNPAEDLIDLRSIFSQSQFAGATPFVRYLKYVQLAQVGGSTEVRIDADGNGAGNTFVALATLTNVNANTLSSRNFVIS
jgi:Domain of unknown function (DUF4347)/Bacterial Ig-like domain/Putative Ig domain/RTX calcium-binding nonapeptide repeat (4 copies)